MIQSPIDAIRFWEFAAVIASLLLAWLIPASSGEYVISRLGWVRAVAQKRTLAVLIVGIVGFCGDALVSSHNPPVPTSLDEFSYLLAADTFAHGRITNPTPPMPEYFETPEVLVRPSYQSKYPPGQALFLAVGQLVTGNAMFGVWLSSALACAAICWMLQAWTTATWAFYGGILVALRLAFFGPWAQSYWGGMVAALGGALLYGALRRIIDEERNRTGNALWFALGIILLANTRPFEGLLATAPALAMLSIWLFRSSHWLPLRSVALPALILLLLASGAMLQYNRRITGSPWRLPYVAYEKQYDPVPSFIFQGLRPAPDFDNLTMQAAAQDTLWTWRLQHGSGRLIFSASKLLEAWQFLFGVTFSAVFILLVWRNKCSLLARLAQTAVFLLIQFLACLRFLFWPTPSPVWIAVLLAALLIQGTLFILLFRDRWDRLAVCNLLLLAVGISLETWRFHSHYVGPVIAIAMALVIRSLRSANAKIFALLLPVLIIGMTLAESSRAQGILDEWARRRCAMQRQLESEPGKQLVFVYYRPEHDLYEEWIHNRADLHNTAVVWAGSRTAEENCKLIKLFPDRKIWSLDADRESLHPYSTDCSSMAGPDELVPNQ